MLELVGKHRLSGVTEVPMVLRLLQGLWQPRPIDVPGVIWLLGVTQPPVVTQQSVTQLPRVTQPLGVIQLPGSKWPSRVV